MKGKRQQGGGGGGWAAPLWRVVFVLAFWQIGLVALKEAMPLINVIFWIIIITVIVRWFVILVRRKNQGW